MTIRKVGAIVHSLCIVAAVVACSSWTIPLSEGDVLMIPRAPAGQPAKGHPAAKGGYILA